AIHLIFGYRAEGRVVSVEEGKPDVFVTNKQRWSGILGITLAEAENAFIGALPRHYLLKHQAKVFAFLAVKFDLNCFATALFHLNRKLSFTCRLKTKIQVITHGTAINPHY